MSSPVGPNAPLASFLTVDPAGEGAWTAEITDFDWGAAFGGDLLAKAALAAIRDVGPDAALRSIHAQLLAPGAPGARAALRVARLDGARRRVLLESDGVAVLHLVAQFATSSRGPHLDAGGAPSIAAPETLPSDVELARAEGWPERFLAPIEFRRAAPRAWPFPGAADGEPARWSGWLRPRVPLADGDAALHAAALAFASDYRSHWGVEVRLGAAFAKHNYTGVDHALWIHAPIPWTDWWLFETSCDVCRDGRALVQREVWTRDGARIATVLQEGILAPRG